jgi:hypothetical protein
MPNDGETMTSAFRAVRAGGLAAGIVLAMSFAGGVASAEPDSGTAPPPDPSAASQDASPPGPSSSDSTAAGSSSDTSQAPTSKVGNEPTDGVDSSGGAQTSSEGLRAEEDALSGDMGNLADLTAQISEADQQVKDKLAAMEAMGDTVSISDMFEMQMLMNHLSQLSEMSTSVVSASNSALASMARNVKG